MEFDTKIKIILREGLETWQELNITAFLMSGIGATQEIVGEAYRDRDGAEYLPMSRQPILILSGSAEQLQALLQKALTKDCAIAVYTEELFHTFCDADNRASVAEYGTAELHLVGIGIRGKKNQVDRLTKGFAMHP